MIWNNIRKKQDYHLNNHIEDSVHLSWTYSRARGKITSSTQAQDIHTLTEKISPAFSPAPGYSFEHFRNNLESAPTQ